MSLKNTPERYGFVHKAIHWITALIVLGLLWIGAGMAGMGFSPLKLQMYFWHKSFGLLVLFLAVLRILWKFTNPIVQSLPSHKPWEKTLAKVTHFLIYAALVVMPLSGWLMSSAGDFPAPFFGLFEMPDLIAKNETAFKLLREFHEIFAYVIIAVIALHAAGAFKHHFIDRDETLQRMSSRRVRFAAGAALALLTGILLAMPLFIEWVYSTQEKATAAPEAVITSDTVTAPETVAAPAVQAEDETNVSDPQKSAFPHQWVIKPESSSIGFEITQNDEGFSGEFKKYAATIVFDPDNLKESKAQVAIDIASISTGSDDRDGQARSTDWFDAAKFPQAVFKTESFAQTAPNRYLAKGNLTIRGIKAPVELPFSLIIQQASDGSQTAYMQAQLSLNRLDFGIGQGEWKSTKTIGNNVKVMLRIEAWQAAPAKVISKSRGSKNTP